MSNCVFSLLKIFWWIFLFWFLVYEATDLLNHWKLQYLKITQEASWDGTYILRIKTSRNFSKVHCRFIICRLIHIVSVEILDFQVFSSAFYFFFRMLFYIFHLGKLLLALQTLIVILGNLNFFCNLVSDKNHWLISLLFIRANMEFMVR